MLRPVSRFRLFFIILALTALSSAGVLAAPSGSLTFQERVDAQEAIERVYYSYLEGATAPFEDAVPRATLERKVRLYLQQSDALERFWHWPVTAESLRRELQRVTRSTHFQGRLREIFAALGNDAFLIQETLARPALVGRLSRSFFRDDDLIHAASLVEANDALGWLRRGRMDLENNPRWGVMDLVLAKPAPAPRSRDGIAVLELDVDALATRRARLSGGIGEVSEVREEHGAFVIEMLLADTGDGFRVGTYAVPKRTWDDWWDQVSPTLEVRRVAAVADPAAVLPELSGPEGACVGDLWDNGALDDLPEPRFAHTAVWTGTEVIVWGGIGTLPFLSSGAVYDPILDFWRPMTFINAPLSRRSHTAVWTGTEMIVWAGDQISTYLNDGGRYNPSTDTWTDITTTGAPSVRHAHTAVWTGTEMIVWGGDSGTFAFNSGGRYNPATDSWVATATAAGPLGRAGHVAVWTGGLMIIWGGNDSAAVNTGGRYNPFTDTWALTTVTNAPLARVAHTAVWTGTEMIIWGGVNFTDLQGTGARYDPVTDSWTFVASLNAPGKRRDHTATWTGDKMVVWGGTSGSNLQSGGLYDPVADTWDDTQLVGAPTPRGLHSAVWTGDRMVVWGGSQEGELNTSGAQYNPGSNTWTPTATANGQVGRKDHSAVWTGTEMIIFGGFSTPGPDYLNEGGRYDPLVDTWVETSLTNAPEGRELHNAAWTGSRMLIWGGFDGTDYLNSGARYDPLSDTWSAMTTTGAPAPRQGQSGIWTGDGFIIWGGFEDLACGGGGGEPICQYLRDGAIYDVAGDSWTPTDTFFAPQARYLHTAFWTGTEMLIWGGTNDIGLQNTGARYDPVGDTWAAMTQVGAPTPRNRQLGVWTGTQMVVWGGFDAIDYLDTGGRYDPATDTWLPTSLAGVPAGRIDHSAIWTGEFMVIWGGFDGNQFPYLGSGAQYDPGADAWAGIALENAPSPRNDHSAVWIGDRMIIWGGSDGSVLNTGGRYVLNLVPGEATGLIFTNDTDLSWNPVAGSGVLHDLLRGAMEELPVGAGAGEVCLESGIPENSAIDGAEPAVGEAFWYLSRGANVCATGTYGSDSLGGERISATCP